MVSDLHMGSSPKRAVLGSYVIANQGRRGGPSGVSSHRSWPRDLTDGQITPSVWLLPNALKCRNAGGVANGASGAWSRIMRVLRLNRSRRAASCFQSSGAYAAGEDTV